MCKVEWLNVKQRRSRWDGTLRCCLKKPVIIAYGSERVKFKLDRRSLQTIYFSFIRPIIEYADVVWDKYALYEANELEKIQIEAARIATGATKLVSIDSL